MLQYVFVRQDDHMSCMDHEFTLLRNYYGGKHDVLYSFGYGGILLTATSTLAIDFYFSWDLMKDMSRPDGVCGH